MPYTIPNPNYGKKGFWYQLKDTTSQTLSIPCGHCSECIGLKQTYLIQRFQMECLCNRAFFVTLTYKQEMLPHYITPSGYRIAFSDYSDFVNLVECLKNSGQFPGIRACAVSEFGGNKGRPHWHAVFFLPNDLLPDFPSCLDMESRLYDFVYSHWARNFGSRKRPEYVRLCDYHECFKGGKLYRNYDLHYINPSLTDSGADSVAWYVFKYMLKPSTRETRLQQALHLNLDEDSYSEVWNIVRPRLYKSQGFGLNALIKGRSVFPDFDIVRYLWSCIDSSDPRKGFPQYYVPSNNGRSGVTFPLARYYRDNGVIFSAEDALNLYYNNPNPDHLPELRSGYENLQMLSEYKKRLVLVDSHGSDDYFLDF